VLNVRKGRTVFVINQSADLTFRDFKKACSHSDDLRVKIHMLTEETLLTEVDAAIYYATFKNYLQKHTMIPKDRRADSIIIIDEFDSIYFEKSNDLREKIDALGAMSTTLALSGSDL
jgi:hypothetical protein